MALLTTTKPAGGSDPPAGFVVSGRGPEDEGWEDKRNRWACPKFVFHVKQRSPLCRRGAAAAGRWGGVPVADRFSSDTLPSPPWADPSVVGQAHLSQGMGAAAGGDTRAHGAGWTARSRGGDGGCAGRRCTLR
ncbi:conserved hypothetical protein [Micrococcus luteus]|nr:conserved hypothetical protein [Micrococcus luteus]